MATTKKVDPKEIEEMEAAGGSSCARYAFSRHCREELYSGGADMTRFCVWVCGQNVLRFVKLRVIIDASLVTTQTVIGCTRPVIDDDCPALLAHLACNTKKLMGEANSRQFFSCTHWCYLPFTVFPFHGSREEWEGQA